MNTLLRFVAVTLFMVLALKLHAESNWENIVNSISMDKSNNVSKQESTADFTERKYGIRAERETAQQKIAKQSQKTAAIGFSYRTPAKYTVVSQTVTNTGLITTTDTEKQEFLGLSISSKINLESLGKSYQNIFSQINLYNDVLWVGFEKQWFPFSKKYSNKGLFFGFGPYMGYATKEGYFNKGDVIPSLGATIGYNFKSFQVKIIDNYSSKTSAKDGLSINLGFRF